MFLLLLILANKVKNSLCLSFYTSSTIHKTTSAPLFVKYEAHNILQNIHTF